MGAIGRAYWAQYLVPECGAHGAECALCFLPPSAPSRAGSCRLVWQSFSCWAQTSAFGAFSGWGSWCQVSTEGCGVQSGSCAIKWGALARILVPSFGLAVFGPSCFGHFGCGELGSQGACLPHRDLAILPPDIGIFRAFEFGAPAFGPPRNRLTRHRPSACGCRRFVAVFWNRGVLAFWDFGIWDSNSAKSKHVR